MVISKLWANEFDYRRNVLKAVLLVIIFAGCIFVVSNWQAGFKVYAGIELGLVILSIGILTIHQKTPNLTLWSSVFLVALYSVILIGIYSISFNSTLYTWLYIIPVLSYLLLGIKLGSWFTIVYLGAGIGVLIFAHLLKNPDINPIAVVNIALCLTAIWVLSYTYESKRTAMVERLQQMAAIDPLTGLNNRLHLNSVFEMLCQSIPQDQQSVSMLLLDLDHFKKVNDQYGHDVGDEVLVKVSRLINEMRRRNDWAFRFGGEEFCLLIPNTNEAQTQQVAERLRQAVEKDITIDDFTLNITVSIGVARWPLDGNNLAQIYKAADARLYQAKEQGRNRIIRT
ncbi:GGDEF domain-containing protein [Paraglaciecola sp. 20A4]|uniref:GGDEF domain-containing protein n=1 Tax=Paraglaciecola sp. 20A4 TaxID=2687288 RepID=UPI00140A316B|nr:GGDEF domain-containing protein [Paraglaciecola sp. 20A4]